MKPAIVYLVPLECFVARMVLSIPAEDVLLAFIVLPRSLFRILLSIGEEREMDTYVAEEGREGAWWKHPTLSSFLSQTLSFFIFRNIPLTHAYDHHECFVSLLSLVLFIRICAFLRCFHSCPRGHFCVEGSAAPLGCPDGSYQDKLQQSTCKTCEAGFFCHTNATLPRLCPASKYCPAGTTYPLTCPNGTYSTSTGLLHVSQCLPCPPGFFCQLGSIVRNCSAGYVCRFGNALPSPPFDARVNVQGGECPPGFYCPSGTSVPLPCLNGTFNPFTRGDQPLSCGPCPAGYQCEAGNPVPFPCSPGYYCPLQRDPQPCRTGTYNPRSFSTNSSACIACPPGFFCPISGLPDFRSFNCPLGHFCPVGSIQPLPCPSGTFRNTTNGATQVCSWLVREGLGYQFNGILKKEECKTGKSWRDDLLFMIPFSLFSFHSKKFVQEID